MLVFLASIGGQKAAKDRGTTGTEGALGDRENSIQECGCCVEVLRLQAYPLLLPTDTVFLVHAVFTFYYMSFDLFSKIIKRYLYIHVYRYGGNTALQLRVAGFAGPTTLRSCISIRSTARF